MSGHDGRKRSAFDVHKATAATALLVKETGESMYPVMKMMYLADKLHLERYGRFIAGDTYCAMGEGPVPSTTYDLMKHLRGEAQRIADADVVKEYLQYGPSHQLKLVQDPDIDELSDSEIECIQEVVKLYHRFGKWAVRDMSHDDAWRATWGRRIFSKSVSMSTQSIAAGLENSEALLDHLTDPEPGAAA